MKQRGNKRDIFFLFCFLILLHGTKESTRVARNGAKKSIQIHTYDHKTNTDQFTKQRTPYYTKSALSMLYKSFPTINISKYTLSTSPQQQFAFF